MPLNVCREKVKCYLERLLERQGFGIPLDSVTQAEGQDVPCPPGDEMLTLLSVLAEGSPKHHMGHSCHLLATAAPKPLRQKEYKASHPIFSLR